MLQRQKVNIKSSKFLTLLLLYFLFNFINNNINLLFLNLIVKIRNYSYAIVNIFVIKQN